MFARTSLKMFCGVSEFYPVTGGTISIFLIKGGTVECHFARLNLESDVDYVPDNFPQHSDINKHVTLYNTLHIDEVLIFNS